MAVKTSKVLVRQLSMIICLQDNCEDAQCLLIFVSSIDASWESGRFGRLVNHSKLKPNCDIQVQLSTLCNLVGVPLNLLPYLIYFQVEAIEGKPHLILVAAQDIEEREELTYDYGIK